MAAVFFKKVAKKIIPRKHHHYFSQTGSNIQLALITSIYRRLPLRQAVRFREISQLFGQLDFQTHNQTIIMQIDSKIQIGRLNACRKEPETINWLEEFLQPNDVFYDIGANVGAYSFVAHTITHGECLIYAFEPSFSTFSFLCKNILLNHFDKKILPFQIALWDKTGMLVLNYSEITPGASLHTLLNEDEALIDNEQTQHIIAYRLDDFSKQFKLQPPNLIKLDVDGSELEVLYGSDEILRNPTLRSLLVEIQKENKQKVLKYLEMRGFELYRVNPRGNAEEFANYIFQRTII